MSVEAGEKKTATASHDEVAAEENMDNKDKMLVFLRIVGFDGFGLYDHRRISPRQRFAFGGDSASDIARRQSQRHSNSSSDSHNKILDGFYKSLFLNVSQFHCFNV